MSSNSNKFPRVCVILAYFNGSKYLKEQLHSIDCQEGVEVELVIVDDCSDLQEFDYLKQQVKLLKVKTKVIKNPRNLGSTDTYLSSLTKVISKFDFYAFADQDDIWLENKLSVAIDKILKEDRIKPTLYGSRTRIMWSDGSLGPLSQKRKSPSFRNALSQSLAGGNTMVFCDKAAKLLAKSYKKNVTYSAHDWWCYILITGADGKVVFDNEPYILYRQHERNLIGENNSFVSKVRRFKMLFQGVFKLWNDQNINAILNSRELFIERNLEIVKSFDKARRLGATGRFRAFFKLRIFRHSLLSNLGLLVGWFFGRV
jgi:glycosyltransferase involved in cell wall biosynthesis